jgi:hypothetical protein
MTMPQTASTAGSRPRQQSAAGTYAILVILLGLVLVGRGGWDMVQALQFVSSGVATEARLVGINSVHEGRGRMGHYAEVRYVAAGKSMQAITEDRIVPGDHRLGAKLQVFYLSGEPQRVRLSAGGIGFWPWFILGLGSAIEGAGLFWLLRLRRRA